MVFEIKMNKTPVYLRLVEPTKNYDGYRIAAGITRDECTKSLEKLPIIPYENNRKIFRPLRLVPLKSLNTFFRTHFFL